MKNLLLTGMLLLACGAGAEKFPIFDDQRIPRPEGLREISAAEFKIDLKRIEARQNGSVYGGKDALLRLGEYFLNDPNGRESWQGAVNNAVEVLNNWDFQRRGFGANRFIYALYSGLENLALVYMYSGHRELGMFLRAHLTQAADLPMEFWLHSELRGHDREKPLGQLETSTLGRAYAATLSMAGELLSATELDKARAALREKAYIPSLNWLDNPRVNNFTAVIGTGAYVCARYFDDPAGMDKALDAIAFFLSGSIEDDGSYGEGGGYFSYPISTMLPGVVAMDKAAREKAFGKSGLRYSARWMAYPYLYARDREGAMQPWVTHFGDNSFRMLPSPSVNTMIASLYGDGVAMWLMRKFNVEWRNHWRLQLLAYADGKPMPKALSPAEAGLPLVKSFDSGECFIRSSWDDNGIVLALLSGGSGNGTRIKYSHRRPEINSICMGAYGEYLVVSSGSASYRSPLHYTWDRVTRAANTITIDDKNQLFPGVGRMNKWGLNINLDDIWIRGNPKSTVVECRPGKIADLLVNEAAKAYHPKMKHARRSVVFVRDPGFFVIVDRMDSREGGHKYSWYMHFNNRDGKAALEPRNDGNWLLTRPQASLLIRVAADTAVTSEIGQGYMHGSGRDYSPGGEHEGKLGSSIELALHNQEKRPAATFMSILHPLKPGGGTPIVSGDISGMNVGQYSVILNKGTLKVSGDGVEESYKLW